MVLIFLIYEDTALEISVRVPFFSLSAQMKK